MFAETNASLPALGSAPPGFSAAFNTVMAAHSLIASEIALGWFRARLEWPDGV
ncbi:MAG: hypothetical protein OXN79_07785 [bacterium]|nr:hypothetical protein [bacterium]